MATIVLNRFGGMLPRYGDQAIPMHAASSAVNCLLLSGELRSLHGKSIAHDFREEAFTVARAYRIPYSGNYIWTATDDSTYDLLKGPLVNDAYDRYYSTSEVDAPRMNTAARINAADPAYLLGIPAPTGQLTVVPTGGTGTVVTRAYTYTFVSAYGEEGQPVDAGVASGPDDATWTLSGFDALDDIADVAERTIDHINIYRTVTAANGSSEYHFVSSHTIHATVTTDYNDSISTAEVALNDTLQSIDWATPPSTLIGIIAHPNGFLVGFSGRDIYFSVPYRPHAWPAGYVLSTKDPIVGLGVFGNTIVIATTGSPYTCTGIRPESMSFAQADTPEPCSATRRSIVSMPFGVYYPTANGLILASPQGFENATKTIVTKDEWQRDYNQSQLIAARWQSQYVAFYNLSDGFMFAPDEPNSAFVELGNGVWAHSTVQNDIHSADVFLIQDNVVYYWNPVYGIAQTYVWKSREIITPRPVNFGAFKVEINSREGTSAEAVAEATAENAIRFAYPLNPLNFSVLNGVRKVATISTFDGVSPVLENSQPTHKSPLTDIAALSALDSSSLRLRLYGDDQLVADVIVDDNEIYRLPAGYKATRWYVELEGNHEVRSVKIAETSKELYTV